jgi:hypothetical protein
MRPREGSLCCGFFNECRGMKRRPCLCLSGNARRPVTRQRQLVFGSLDRTVRLTNHTFLAVDTNRSQ